MRKSRIILAGAAIALALSSAALGKRLVTRATPSVSDSAPATVSAFELADLLSRAPPEAVVIALDDARHPLRGAVPASAFGSDDASLVAGAPKARHITLVGRDVVRVDRLARRLIATGREVDVLAGGIDAWDRAMDADPSAPAPSAGADAWQRHRSELALRRAFGDAQAKPAAPVAAPAVPNAAAAGGAPKKREGC